MIAQSADFKVLSQKVAARFLHTMVVVDDLAELDGRASESASGISGAVGIVHLPAGVARRSTAAVESDDIVTSAEHEGSTKAGVDPGDGHTSRSIPPELTDNRHTLDAKQLIDHAAVLGLVAAVLRPAKGEDPYSKALAAAQRADIVVLDWVIHGSFGETTLRLLAKILAEDELVGGRLRVFAVYTGEEDLYGVANRVAAALVPDVANRVDSFTFQGPSVRVAVFAKPRTRVPKENAELLARVVSESALAARLIAEFSELTSGLVSNVAMESLAELRRRTHHLLTKVHPDLDAPYLAHRALLKHPEDARRHLVELICSELRSVLEFAAVDEGASMDAIRLRLKLEPGDTFAIYTAKGTLPVDFDNLMELLSLGVERFTLSGLSNTQKERLFETLTRTFAGGDEDVDELECRFAELTAIRRAVSEGSDPNHAPRLGLGSIVESDPFDAGPGEVARFWLCIQPLCDSVRLEKKAQPFWRAFPFLPLVEVLPDAKGEMPRFDYVLSAVNGGFVKVRLCPSAFSQRMIRFRPVADEGGSIKAQRRSDGWWFVADDDARTALRWVANLKPEYAQEVANGLAAGVARVGLNRSEWLRRSGGK